MNELSLNDFDWLQGEQLRHDSLVHAHIVRLPMQRQLVHCTLKLACCQGALLGALHSDDREAVQRVIVDSFITLLTIANTLGISLRTTGVSHQALPARLRTSEEVMSAYVEVVGEMSRACAAFDDDWSFPSHTVLGTSMATLIMIVIDLANLNAVALIETIPHRWHQVEKNASADGSAGQFAHVA